MALFNVALLSDFFSMYFSVHLARRVLQLERANTALRKEVENEQAKSRTLGEEVRIWFSICKTTLNYFADMCIFPM